MKNFFNLDDIHEMYDLVILGAGPSGCTAGLYAARDALSVLILEKNYPGGHVSITETVENYPGIEEPIAGSDLAQKFFSQALRYGAQIRFGVCSSIELIEKGIKLVHLEDGRSVKAKTVIVATGSKPRTLDVPGEKQFIGRGVSFCATCDGGFFRNKEVIVVGGGNSALEEGMYLTKFASKVTVIHRRNEFRASKIVQQRAFANEKMKFITPAAITEVFGTSKIEGVKVKNFETNEESVIEAEGLFIFIGWLPNSDFLKNILKLTEEGFIESNEETLTSVPGIFAAGDIRKKGLMQIVTAASDGAVAAKMAEKYIIESE